MATPEAQHERSNEIQCTPKKYSAQIPKNRREEAPRKLFKIKYQQLCLGPPDKVMFVSKPHMVTAEAHHEISKEMQCTPTEIFSRGLNIDNNCFKTVTREEGLRKLFTIMLQHLGLEQPLPNTCPKSSCWCMLARGLGPWSRVAVWEQFIQSMFGVWIENFSEVCYMSFDPLCWALVLAIWEGRLKVASRPTVRNQVIETFFWRPFFGPPPQCAFHLLWFFMLGLGCDHIRDGLVSGCRKPSCWNVISNSCLWPAFRITVLKQFCGCWGSGLNISSGCIASPLILHVGPRLWPMKCGHEDGPQTWTKNASKNHRDKGSNKAFQNDASFHLIWGSRTGGYFDAQTSYGHSPGLS